MRHLWAAALLALAPICQAGTLATYDFTGQTGTEASVPVTSSVSSASFGPITRGGGITPEAGANSINSSGWTVGTGYYSFTVTPNAGTTLDISGLSYTDRRSTSEGPPNIAVEFSTQANFANPTVVATYSLPDNANHRETLDLSAFSALANLTTSVEFRIFATGATGSVGTYRLGIDASSAGSGLPANLMLTSPTAVPEPAGVALLAIGLVGAGWITGRRYP